jgi:WD40 repeat protein
MRYHKAIFGARETGVPGRRSKFDRHLGITEVTQSRVVDTSAGETVRAFLSYSRKDLAFARRLGTALDAHGVEAFVDISDIQAFEDWWTRTEALIRNSEAIVFVISPNSIQSPTCLKELQYAEMLNKRLAPVILKQVEPSMIPENLRRLNFVSFEEDERFESELQKVVTALRTDIAWLRKHTELGELAYRWSSAKAGGLLLRPPLLEEAEAWIASRPRGAPHATSVTRDFIALSRSAATRRRNNLTISLIVGLILAVGLAGTALWQRGTAIEQQKLAESRRMFAEEQQKVAEQQRAFATKQEEIARKQRDVAGKQRALATKNEKEAEQQRDSALVAQSRFLADLANQRSHDGDAGTALLFGLEALPQQIAERPYVAEAEAALLRSLYSRREVELAVSYGGKIEDAIFNRDGTRVLTASAGESDNTARIWSVDKGEIIAAFVGHTGDLRSASFSSDEQRIATASSDTTARVWDVASRKTISVLRGHAGGVEAAAFSPDGQRIVTASSDRTARIWNANTGETVAILAGHSSNVLSATFSPDGRRVITASFDNTARMWDVSSFKSIAIFVGHSGIVNNAAFSPDGGRVVTSSDDKTARVWDVRTGKAVLVLSGHTQGIAHSEFSQDGRRIVTASYDGTAKVWDAQTGNLIVVLAGHAGTVLKASFDASGRRVLTSSSDGTVRVWDVEARVFGEQEQTCSRSKITLSEPFDRLARLPYEQFTIGRGTAENSRCSKLYHTLYSPMIDVVVAHAEGVASARFNHGGTRFVTASYDSTARVWVMENRRVDVVLKGHSDFVWHAEFSRDDRQIVTASVDRTSRIWDANTGILRRTLAGHAASSPMLRSTQTAPSLRLPPTTKRSSFGTSKQAKRLLKYLASGMA